MFTFIAEHPGALLLLGMLAFVGILAFFVIWNEAKRRDALPDAPLCSRCGLPSVDVAECGRPDCPEK
jgi:hypothetical protein